MRESETSTAAENIQRDGLPSTRKAHRVAENEKQSEEKGERKYIVC
jgi:hypothetical protein